MAKKKLSAWNKKVSKVAKANPSLSFKQVVEKAKKEYKGSGKSKSTKRKSKKKARKKKKID